MLKMQEQVNTIEKEITIFFLNKYQQPLFMPFLAVFIVF
jgi:hypothetical protein